MLHSYQFILRPDSKIENYIAAFKLVWNRLELKVAKSLNQIPTSKLTPALISCQVWCLWIEFDAQELKVIEIIGRTSLWTFHFLKAAFQTNGNKSVIPPQATTSSNVPFHVSSHHTLIKFPVSLIQVSSSQLENLTTLTMGRHQKPKSPTSSAGGEEGGEGDP